MTAPESRTPGAELHPFLLRQGRDADASGVGSIVTKDHGLCNPAGRAVRTEAEDAGVKVCSTSTFHPGYIKK